MRGVMARIRNTLHSGGTYKALRDPPKDDKKIRRKIYDDKDGANVCLSCKKKECSGRCKKFMK